MMYMTPTDKPAQFPKVPFIAGAALVVSAILILYLGILPTRILDLAAASISTIFEFPDDGGSMAPCASRDHGRSCSW